MFKLVLIDVSSLLLRMCCWICIFGFNRKQLYLAHQYCLAHQNQSRVIVTRICYFFTSLALIFEPVTLSLRYSWYALSRKF